MTMLNRPYETTEAAFLDRVEEREKNARKLLGQIAEHQKETNKSLGHIILLLTLIAVIVWVCGVYYIWPK